MVIADSEESSCPLNLGNVYGGSALGAVNAKKQESSVVYSGTVEAPKATTVNIYGGTVSGSVFGGGLGEKTESSDIAAQNFGKATVNMEGGSVSEAIYGGANANGVLKADAEVTLLGGTVGTKWTTPVPDPLPDVVFGGGKGETAVVTAHPKVMIGDTITGHENNRIIIYYDDNSRYGNIFGGGNAAPTM